MAIISFDKDAIIDYLPEYGGNRDSADPCIVRLKYVPYSRVQHYSSLIAAKTRDLRDPARNTEVAREVQAKQFVESVLGVNGYYIGEREVTDPAEFYETADSELILEVIRAMESQSRLGEGQRKNF